MINQVKPVLGPPLTERRGKVVLVMDSVLMVAICPQCGRHSYVKGGGACTFCGAEVVLTRVTRQQYMQSRPSDRTILLKKMVETYASSGPGFRAEMYYEQLKSLDEEKMNALGESAQSGPSCPRCGGTRVEEAPKKRGFLGMFSDKADWVCQDCGNRW